MKTLMLVKFAIAIALFSGIRATPAFGQTADPKKPSCSGAAKPCAKNPPQSQKPPSAKLPPPPPPKTANSIFSWKIGGPVVPWNLERDRWAEMTVSVAEGAPIKKLKLSQSTLVEAGSNNGVVLHTTDLCFRVRRGDDGDNCEQSIDLSAPDSQVAAGPQTKPKEDTNQAQQAKAYKRTVRLEVRKGFTTVGTFTGSLFFDTDPFTDTQPITLTVQQTYLRWQAVGVVIIFVGVAVAWLVTIFARSRIARDQALMPALLLQERLQALQTIEAAFPEVLKEKTTASAGAITTLIESLNTDALDRQNFLPPAIPAFGPSATKTTEYQTFLTTVSTKAGDLDIIVSEGLKLLSVRWKQGMDPADLADLEQAFGTIDGISGNLLLDPQALRTLVNAALAAFNNAHQSRVNAARALGVNVQAETIQPAAQGQKSFVAVRLEVQTVTWLFWLVWGLLSVVIGTTVLILPAPGFGSITDFVRCFLWGFGLPVAGNSIQSLTMGSLNTQLGVSIARS